MLALIVAGIGVCIRLSNLMIVEKPVSSISSGKRIDIATLRGTIYDCNLKPLTNSEYEFHSAAKPTYKAFESLKSELNEEELLSIRERMEKTNPVVVKTQNGIYDCPDIVTAAVPVRYSESSLACHIIGYLNSAGEGISGIEKIYNLILSKAQKEVYARFSTDANGRVLLGENIELSDFSAPQTGVVLTIDKDIQYILENAIDESGAECAAGIVIEIESGAIRACVSRPLFNQNNISGYLDDENSPLINRAFLPFAVGSVFKPVVAAAALENDINDDFAYNCTGSVEINGNVFNCHKKDGHGVIDMKTAVSVSCNTYFIALARETGAESIIETASLFGFGKETKLDDDIYSYSGNLPSPDEIDSVSALANLSFGQGSLTATPLQICTMMAAIANNGTYIKPYLVEGFINEDSEMTEIKRYSEKIQIINEVTANRICEFLLSVVEKGSGKRAYSNYVTLAGKTATAQTGSFVGDEEKYNAWFTGFFPYESPEYAVVIMKENGGEGAVSCAPVFKKTAEEIADLEQ